MTLFHSFIIKFSTLTEKEIEVSAARFVEKHDTDVSAELVGEMIHLKHIHKENFKENLAPLDFFTSIHLKIWIPFSQTCV